RSGADDEVVEVVAAGQIHSPAHASRAASRGRAGPDGREPPAPGRFRTASIWSGPRHFASASDGGSSFGRFRTQEKQGQGTEAAPFSGRRLPVQPGHAEILDLHEVLDPVFRPFAAHARFL